MPWDLFYEKSNSLIITTEAASSLLRDLLLWTAPAGILQCIFMRERPTSLRQRGQGRLFMGVQGKSKQGGAVGSSGPTSHEEQAQPPVRTGFQGLLRSKGGFPTLSKTRVILVASQLLDLYFPGHFTHKVPREWSLDEGAWSCPGHTLGWVLTPAGGSPGVGSLGWGRLARGIAWHTHSSRSPACSSAGPGGTSAGPSCKQPW